MLISTKFGNTPQTHVVGSPGGRRTQLTFFETPVTSPTPIPGSDGTIFFMMDKGGSEKWWVSDSTCASRPRLAHPPRPPRPRHHRQQSQG